MPYVDALYDRQRDVVKIAERVNGKRILKEDKFEHVFYYSHPAGSHLSIFDDPCKRFASFNGRKATRELKRLKAEGKTIFEPDIRPEFRHLAKHYMGADAPLLNIGFFDIEADFDPDKGYAPTDDPFNAVTAITVHLSQSDRLITLALCPKTYTAEEGQKIASRFEDTFLFTDEAEMLSAFLDVIEDTDVLSGWNSEGYDIPYLVNRVKRLLDENAARRFCLWGQKPRDREYMKFGKIFKTYDLVGRVHLDYLLLYQKHNTQQQHSYRLDFIGEIEVGEKKVPYDGTLDKLYKEDFDKFIEYNRQDVALLVKIDKKRKFIELANQIAHTNCVLLKTTMGSVALVEQAIINEMHSMGFVVPERREREEEPKEKAPKSFRTTIRKHVVREVDPDLVEGWLHDAIEGLMAEDETVVATLMATLEERNEGPIEENETLYQVFSEYLRDENPMAFNAMCEECTVEVEIEEEIEDRSLPMNDDDEDDDDGRTPVVGAYVAKPKTGIHREVACVDINSLYPSAIRALNMSPETVIAQVRSTETMELVAKRIAEGTPRAEAWEGIFYTLEVGHMLEQDDVEVVIDFEDGRVATMTGAQLYEYIFNPKNEVCITANGTIFRTDKEGIIPRLLASWYADRKVMQFREKCFGDMAKGVEIDDDLLAALSE